jgi:hypothetical protein
MNWSRALIAGVVAGIGVWLLDFLTHRVILGATYEKFPVFQVEEPASPFIFLWIEVWIFIFVAILFAKTYDSWSSGWKGGATFGLFFGLATFFIGFFSPVVIAGFPYFLAWCHGGTGLIAAVLGGAIIGSIYKPA